MSEASGSRHSVGYVPEVTPGVTPATPVFKKLRHNTTSLNLSKASFQSNELRDDRQIADFRHGTRSAAGNVVGELSASSYDDMLQAALGGTWVADVLKAGIVRRSFTLERRFSDVNQFMRYRGAEVDSLQLAMGTGGVVALTMGFWAMGMDVASAIVTGATYTDAPITAPMDALTGEVTEGGSPIAVVTSVNLNLSNGMNPRFVIGSAESLQASIGRSNLTGTMDAYFEDVSLYNKFINEETSSLSVQATDGDNIYTFLVPKLKYTGGDVPVAGEGPISIAMPFQAMKDPTLGTNIQITRVLA